MTVKNVIILKTILTNLLLGNAILFIGGHVLSGDTVNYTLMLGMSVACVLVYLLVLKNIQLASSKTPKLAVISVLCCMSIVILGNAISLIINDPNELSDNLFAAFIFGIAGNVVLFPVSLGMGLLNLFWFRALKEVAYSK